MNPKKDFDCVQMKWDIQKKIAEESKGMTEKEKWAFYRDRIKNNPTLSRFLKGLDASQQDNLDYRKVA